MISIPDPRLRAPAVTRPPERLGTVSCPSGRLAVIDVGLLGDAWRDWAIVVEGVPTGETPVLGARVGTGEYAECWKEVMLPFAGGVTATTETVGEVVVDFARIGFVDTDAIVHWSVNDSLDGLADFVFWGRDAEALAVAVDAPRIGDGEWGWCDLAVDEVIRRGTSAERTKVERGWKLATDYRPHTQHFTLLARARASATGSGTVALGDSAMSMFFTSWGDGVFPVVVERDAAGALLRVRIVLATDDAIASMDAVNP